MLELPTPFWCKAYEPSDLNCLGEEIALLKSKAELTPADHNRWWEYGKVLAFFREFLKTSCSVLDVGGAGSTLPAALSALGHRVEVIDTDPRGEALVKQFEGLGYDGLTWTTGNAEALPYPDDSFDCVMAVSVIEHIEDDLGAIKEMHRVLKPGGYLILSFDFVKEERPPTSHQLRFYTEEGLKKLVGWLRSRDLVPVEAPDYNYAGEHITCFGDGACTYNGAMLVVVKASNKVNAVICAYWPARHGHIQRIVDDLRAGSRVPDKIFVLNNHPEHRLLVDNAYVVNSSFNFECRGKFVFALMDVADYYLLLDDDTSVALGTLEAYMRYAHKGCCFGYLGVCIPEDSFNTGPRVWPHQVQEETPCDSFCGCGMFMSFDAIVRVLIAEDKVRLRREYGRWATLGDDILAGLSNRSSVIPMEMGTEFFLDLGYEDVAMYWGREGGAPGIVDGTYVAQRDEFAAQAKRALADYPIPEF